MSQRRIPAYVPPVASWGTKLPYSGPSAVVLSARADVAVADVDLEFWSLVIETIADHAAQAERTEMFVLEEGANWPKRTKSERQVLLKPESIQRWWQNAPPSSMARVPNQNWDLMLSSTDREGQRRLLVQAWIETPRTVDLSKHLQTFAELARGCSAFYGFVGLGKVWRNSGPFQSGSSVLGYGPAVVAELTDLDLVQANPDFVEVKKLDSRRGLLTAQPGANQIEAVTEIRRLCWPGIGLQHAPSDVDAGSLYFEGPPGVPSQTPVSFRVVQRCTTVLEELASGSTVDEVIGAKTKVLTQPDAQIDAHSVEDLKMLVEAWRRGATALMPHDSVVAGQMVECSVEDTGSEVVLTRGAAPTASVSILDDILEEEWKWIFPSPPFSKSTWAHDNRP